LKKLRKDYRLSEEAVKLIEALTKKWGIPATSVIELSVRKAAEQEGIKIGQG
jgi:hypothetical protein